ncbi:MAG: sensor histidine kinase [Bacteroidota bacterium]
MKLIANTITRQLFFSFGILVLSLVMISVFSLFFLWRTRTINTISLEIDNQHLLINQLIKTDVDFLRFETVNQNYFKTGRSVFLERRDSLSEIIETRNETLHRTMLSNRFLIDYQFHQIDSTLAKYNNTLETLIEKINKRGFKDYGLEGTMRNFAHRLESKQSSIPLNALLTLRRHEKDFLLRKEGQYVGFFNRLADDLVSRHAGHDEDLMAYQETFNRLTQLDIEIGILPTEGLLGQLNQQTIIISAKLKLLTDVSNRRAEELIEESALFFSIICVVTIILCSILTYFTSTRLARPIKKLSQSMGKFIVNEGLNEKELENSAVTDEIGNLSQSFIKLTRKLRAQFGEIQQKSQLLEKQNKELQKLNEELDRFIYSAAHDLKSPLTSLDGLIRLAKKEIDDPENEHYFRMMIGSVQKLYGFIRDITDYAKNKRQQLCIEKINLHQVVIDIIEDLKFLPHADRILEYIHVDGAYLFTDKTRLEIVLKNIVSNSFRYLDLAKENSFIRIEASIQSHFMSLHISDNGIGIDKQHLPKIFDMFYRAVEHSQGTGIGLFLVKESIKMLGGRISVESVLGQGTTFHIYIPNLTYGQMNIPESEDIIAGENMAERLPKLEMGTKKSVFVEDTF